MVGKSIGSGKIRRGVEDARRFSVLIPLLGMVIGLAGRVEEALRGCEKPITVAVMGCIVNGPGEAREADIGIAGGEDCGVLFVKGELKERLPYDELLPALLRYVEAM